MAILSNAGYGPIVRDERFGRGCEVGVFCKDKTWYIAFFRNQEEVFRVLIDFYTQSEMSFFDAIVQAAKDNINDFVNAEKTDPNCNGLLSYLQKRVSLDLKPSNS